MGLPANTIKSANTPLSLTADQIAEYTKCADPVTGPHYFLSNYFYIQHPTKGNILYKPYAYQTELINIYHNYRNSISMLSRQLGKTGTAAGYLLWVAMFNPDSTILIASNKHSSALEIMHRIRYAYEYCPEFIKCGVKSYNKGSIEFDNESRIISQATTENTGRGMSITLLFIDEFAFVRPSIAKEFWTSISPTLSTGGKCIITSTPNSDEDQFWEIWTEANKTIDEYGNTTNVGINGFKAYKAYWYQHPERSEEWAKQERAKIGDERFEREHNLRPIIYEETLISPIHLSKLVGIEPIETQGQVRWYGKPQKDKTYLVALDPSLGTGGDNAAIQVFQMPEMIQIAEWCHNKTPVQRQVFLIKEITNVLFEAIQAEERIYYSVENNTLGEAALLAIESIGEDNFKGIFLSEPKKVGQAKRYRRGFNTTNKSKITACLKLKSLIETNRIHILSKPLISEIKTFVALENSFKARPGSTDDLVMSIILIIRMAEVIKNFDPDIEKHMRDNVDEYIEPLPFIASFFTPSFS